MEDRQFWSSSCSHKYRDGAVPIDELAILLLQAAGAAKKTENFGFCMVLYGLVCFFVWLLYVFLYVFCIYVFLLSGLYYLTTFNQNITMTYF